MQPSRTRNQGREGSLLGQVVQLSEFTQGLLSYCNGLEIEFQVVELAVAVAVAVAVSLNSSVMVIRECNRLFGTYSHTVKSK